MRSVHLLGRRMPIPIPPHIPDIDTESVPIKPYLLFGALVQRQVLTFQWLNDNAESLSVGVGIIQTAVI